jgi:hypothetical protein
MFHEGQKPRLSEALDFVEIPYQSTFNLNRKCIRMKLKYVYASLQFRITWSKGVAATKYMKRVCGFVLALSSVHSECSGLSKHSILS